MNHPATLPPGLPPLPPVPPGFDRWIDRGTEWESGCATYACTPLDAKFAGEWVAHHDAPAHGSPTHYYLEAVREPAVIEVEGPPQALLDYCREMRIQAIAMSPGERNAALKRALEMGEPSGVEARVCEDIAARQRLGIAKYGVTVEQSPDDMLRHAYEEALDLAVYLKAESERRGRVCEDALSPFRRVARGIPDNWPGECILRFDQRADGSIFLSYHGVNDASGGITIAEWRKLLAGREDGWRPIETAPGDGTRILAWTGSYRLVWWDEVDSRDRKGWAQGGLAHDQAWWYDECRPTHWQPLPPPPTTEGHE